MSEPSKRPPTPEPTPGASARRQRTGQQVIGSTSALFAVLIVVMVNYLAFRHYERMDWTSEGMFTLSGKTKKVLDDLAVDVDVYLFMSQGEPSFNETHELLERYRAQSQQVKVHYVDPDREPGEFKILAQRFGVLEGVTATGQVLADVAAVVALGDKKWHVSRDDLVGWDMPVPGEEQEVNIKAEQALTGAIVQVQSGSPTTICVTSGHGEWSLDKAAERSLESLKGGLRHDNILWQDLPTLGAKEVPKECNAVFVLGPMRAFSEPEAKLVLDHVRGGGNALIALDPVIEHDAINPTGFEAGLKELGIRIDASLVVELDAQRLLTPNTVEFVTTDFGEHVTTRPLTLGARVLLPLSRSLSVLERDGSVDVLMRSSEQSFGAIDISRVMAGDQEPTRGAGDLAGPLDLAYATRVGADPDDLEPKPGGRLVVAGDSDFLAGPLIEAPELANFHLASAWTGWLTEREALIEIPPKKIKGAAASFTQEQLMGVLFKVCVLLPGAALLLGVMAWLSRRA
ncbi:MAG: GldG family protein [Myxococcales bacterium]|nr:GldG family protein [Myxococcales bacterium]